MVHLSPSTRGDSLLHVATVDNRHSFAEIGPERVRSNSLGEHDLMPNPNNISLKQ